MQLYLVSATLKHGLLSPLNSIPKYLKICPFFFFWNTPTPLIPSSNTSPIVSKYASKKPRLPHKSPNSPPPPPEIALNSPSIQPDFRWQKKPHTSLNSFPNFAILMPSNPPLLPQFCTPNTPNR